MGHGQQTAVSNANRGVACAEFATLEKAAVVGISSSYGMAVIPFPFFEVDKRRRVMRTSDDNGGKRCGTATWKDSPRKTRQRTTQPQLAGLLACGARSADLLLSLPALRHWKRPGRSEKALMRTRCEIPERQVGAFPLSVYVETEVPAASRLRFRHGAGLPAARYASIMQFSNQGESQAGYGNGASNILLNTSSARTAMSRRIRRGAHTSDKRIAQR